MSEIDEALSHIPHGRMSAVRLVEAELRRGATFEKAAQRAKVSVSTAKHWAQRFSIRKSDLERETPEARIERLLEWTCALNAERRFDEAAEFEAEARKVEAMLARLGKRLAAMPGAVPDPYALARALLERIAAALGPGAGLEAAWVALAEYYRGLQALGAVVSADGRARWEGPLPDGLPVRPAWLPEDPGAVTDEAVWEREIGAALRLL